MSDLTLPEDLLVEIIHQFIEIEVARKDWLRLRLVNSMSRQFQLQSTGLYLQLMDQMHRTFQSAHAFRYLRARHRSCKVRASTIPQNGELWWTNGMVGNSVFSASKLLVAARATNQT